MKVSETVMPGAEPFEVGPADAHVGCVLVHGFTGSPSEMRPIGDRLAAAGVRCYAPLLPGHGTSLDDMEASTAEDWLRGARSAVEKARAAHQQLFVVGFSMGGLLAVNLSLTVPVEGLAVVCMPLSIHDPKAKLMPLLGLFRRYEPPKPPRPSASAAGAPPVRPGVAYEQKPVLSIKRLMGLMKHTVKALPGVEAPLLAVYGALDKTAPVTDGQQVLAAVASASKRLEVLPQSKHMCMFGPDAGLLGDIIGEFAASGWLPHEVPLV